MDQPTPEEQRKSQRECFVAELDELVARMQSPTSSAATDALFRMSSDDLGRAARVASERQVIPASTGSRFVSTHPESQKRPSNVEVSTWSSAVIAAAEIDAQAPAALPYLAPAQDRVRPRYSVPGRAVLVIGALRPRSRRPARFAAWSPPPPSRSCSIKRS
jgi:hypothetical protein